MYLCSLYYRIYTVGKTTISRSSLEVLKGSGVHGVDPEERLNRKTLWIESNHPVTENFRLIHYGDHQDNITYRRVKRTGVQYGLRISLIVTILRTLVHWLIRDLSDGTPIPNQKKLEGASFFNRRNYLVITSITEEKNKFQII